MYNDPKMRKCAYLLADRHLSELPTDVIVAASPRHYGPGLSDEHKLFMWNGLVDHYMELPENELWQLYTRHITQSEPIVKPLNSEIEEMVAYQVEGLLRLEDAGRLALTYCKEKED
jgi:hypothetical protein